MTPEAWDGHGLSRGRPWACRSLPSRALGARWRSTTSTWGPATEPDQWPHDYVTRELHVTLATLPDRLADEGQRRALLAWLVGRAEGPGALDITTWESCPTDYLRGMTG